MHQRCFEAKEITVFPDKNLVRVEGKLNNYVGSKRIKDSQETYEVTFRTYRGRLFFKGIKHLGEGENEDQ